MNPDSVPRYQLKNGATLEDLLLAVTTVWTFETTDRGYALLVAMRELLFGILRTDTNPDSLDIHQRIETPAHRIETLECSFLELFRLWLGVTGHKVPTLENPTLEEAFTVLFGLSETGHAE